MTDGHQGRGLGAELLQTLIDGAAESGAHVMMASIEASNARSVALHERLGFETRRHRPRGRHQVRPLARPDHDEPGPRNRR